MARNERRQMNREVVLTFPYDRTAVLATCCSSRYYCCFTDLQCNLESTVVLNVTVNIRQRTEAGTWGECGW